MLGWRSSLGKWPQKKNSYIFIAVLSSQMYSASGTPLTASCLLIQTARPYLYPCGNPGLLGPTMAEDTVTKLS